MTHASSGPGAAPLDDWSARIAATVCTRLDLPAGHPAADFTRLLWDAVPVEDRPLDAPDDAVALTITTWRAFAAWDGTPQVRVRNPDLAEDGWTSSRTLVMVLHPDMPFVTDSVLIALADRNGVTSRVDNIFFDTLRRDGVPCGFARPATAGAAGAAEAPAAAAPDGLQLRAEVLILAQVDRLDDAGIDAVTTRLTAALADVRVAVADFPAMRARARDLAAALRTSPPPLDAVDTAEAADFLDWLATDHFTFLGYREYRHDGGVIRQVDAASLGVLRHRPRSSDKAMAAQPESTRAFLQERAVLGFTRAGTRSRVHRPAYPDYVTVRQFDAAGNVVGEAGFLGLYTSPVYTERPERIPVIRRKVAAVHQRAGLRPGGFDAKMLAQVLATHPRSELFGATVDELVGAATAIAANHERRRTRVMLRRDPYGMFWTCLVFLPRDRYQTRVQQRIQELLMARLGADDADVDTFFSESVLVRIHYNLRTRHGAATHVDLPALQEAIAELARDWATDLREALVAVEGEVAGRRLDRVWSGAFPAGYCESFAPRVAVYDIGHFERMPPDRRLAMRFYRLPEDEGLTIRLKVYRRGEPLPLSDLLPTLENLGLRVIGEDAHVLQRSDRVPASIQDFLLASPVPLDLRRIGDRFEDAFLAMADGRTDDDAFNRLVLAADLDWREVTLLRAIAAWLKQVRFGFSQVFIADTLLRWPAITRLLVGLFHARHDPAAAPDAEAHVEAALEQALEAVQLLNEDRILRRFRAVIVATVRTNYYRNRAAPAPGADPSVQSIPSIPSDPADPSGAAGPPLPVLALKIAPRAVPEVPRPVPLWEIFVHGPRVQGVHLRGGPIARGGLRWSDRHEDFRTEVLGLVKAQVVKNAVIVPTGAKGGFVVRRPPAGRAAAQQEGIACYRMFIGGLLDLTDNLVRGAVLPPAGMRRHDGDDPYLVVAADKGTATFSDIANAISVARGFWMGDAFASGGSNGYDHKKMGITARGAWISVQRHFAELGVDVQRDPIRVVGIGDMAGDVFGNGMLRSRSLRLVGAFNHLHIFVDPEPDPARSFAERERLFALPGSSWADYDPALVSPGGGVFERTRKSIPIAPELRAALAIDATELAPDDLIRALLRAPVDLIWNGGIGTYVKAAAQGHADVGDRANDALRVDARELRARAFGEGGNLGMTQAARVEYSLAGGRVNTDFIDNSAGVDCSDHEVNIKIILGAVTAAGDMTDKQRNQLLGAMTDAVGELVLANNFRQARVLSLAERDATTRPDEYRRFIQRMEAEQGLDREIEGIASDEALAERTRRGQALTRPELAVLLAYAKMHLKERLIAAQVGRDPVVARLLYDEFPAQLHAALGDTLAGHRLAPEIIATLATNDLVDHMGLTFAVQLAEFVGAQVDEVVRAWQVSAAVFDLRAVAREIEGLPDLAAGARLDLLQVLGDLGRRSTRWFLRQCRARLDPAALIAEFAPAVALLIESGVVTPPARPDDPLTAALPPALVARTRGADALAAALPAVAAARTAGAAVDAAARVHVALGTALGIDWLGAELGRLPTTSHWQALERDALQDELAMRQGELTARVLAQGGSDAAAAEAWLAGAAEFTSAWHAVVGDARRSAGSPDFALFSLTCRKLGDLVRSFA